MMLALLGALTVVVLLAVIMLNLLSPLVALIAVPIVAALLGGFGLTTSKFIITGISGIAPVAGMFVFAILYFGIMTDAGMLDPIIDRILRTVGSKPTRIVVPSGSYVPVLGLPTPSFLMQYASFFVLGVLAYRRGWPQSAAKRWRPGRLGSSRRR